MRHLSQLALTTRAEVSSRHLSFVETGRSRPSREMVLLLARALDVPLRERNARLPDPEEPLLPVVPVRFRKGPRTFHFFSAVTTLGTPQDVTLQEIRIESFFPGDEDTRRHVRALAESG